MTYFSCPGDEHCLEIIELWAYGGKNFTPKI